MTGIVDWATSRARMIITFVVMSIVAGGFAYTTLPKEGAPDIEVPFLFVSVPFPGISAEDSEKLLVRPLEAELADVAAIKSISAQALEGYAAIFLEFDFDWDKSSAIADVRDRVNRAKTSFPDGADAVSINEFSFAEFPILVLSLSGDVPERTLLAAARELKDEIETIGSVLEAGVTGERKEMLEVLIDPLRLEAYDVTAAELISVVQNNNKLIAAGEIESGSGAYSVKIPSAFDDPQDVFNLPVKVNGDRVITLGDIADIRLTFEDRRGTARFNGEDTIGVQVVKRKGANVIDTVAEVRAAVAELQQSWPEVKRQSIHIDFTSDQSVDVANMVGQLEASVLTAIALVMIVVLASLGIRSALLVGFAIPTSFLLCFGILAMFGISISNIVMFGLILAVGMLVDGAIVVVEYADKEIQKGVGPMRAYGSAAKRMFWPIVSSTATTLCAFLPMLFWPGVAGQFMGNLPKTLIFVLSASLIVALIFLPVVGGAAGRLSRSLEHLSQRLQRNIPIWLRFPLLLGFAALFYAAMRLIFGTGGVGILPGIAACIIAALGLSTVGGSFRRAEKSKVEKAGYRRSVFGHFIHGIVGNPLMPFVVIAATGAIVFATMTLYGVMGKGSEFFVATEPERAVAYVQARGNLSLEEKDRLLRIAEAAVSGVDGIDSVFSFAGSGGLNMNTGGAMLPLDTVGQIQVELQKWEERCPDTGHCLKGKDILAEVDSRLAAIPGVYAEIAEQTMGPASNKPVHLRLTGDNWDDLMAATEYVRSYFDTMPGLADQDDSRPLPGIDWEISVDVERAGRFGTNVATIGGMIQLVTRGLTLGTMRTDTSDEEVDIRVRFPEEDRILATLDTLRVRTPQALVPLSNFITKQPVPKLGQIDRFDGERYFDVRAAVAADANANDEIAKITKWLEEEAVLPHGVKWEWTGDFEDQAESMEFLMVAFSAALGLMAVILLAQFNSFYNSVLVLVAVILSTTGVLIGMMVMGQTFSAIMTGTGVVALAGIVVNNNIVLIDTYQEFRQFMPRLEAITRTAEARIRPVLLTTITTMAGLTPMMFGLSVDFINGGWSIDSPTAVWWKQLATAVVFGLGIATALTLVLTPALLALRVWAARGVYGAFVQARLAFSDRESRVYRDTGLNRMARKTGVTDIVWDVPGPKPVKQNTPKAAE